MGIGSTIKSHLLAPLINICFFLLIKADIFLFLLNKVYVNTFKKGYQIEL